MRYYTIDILPKSCELTADVSEFGKFRFNRVPRPFCTTGKILQAKVDELLGDIVGVKTYIDAIMLLGKGIFTQHIDQLRVVFSRLCVALLKVNAPKYSFGLNYIP